MIIGNRNPKESNLPDLWLRIRDVGIFSRPLIISELNSHFFLPKMIHAMIRRVEIELQILKMNLSGRKNAYTGQLLDCRMCGLNVIWKRSKWGEVIADRVPGNASGASQVQTPVCFARIGRVYKGFQSISLSHLQLSTRFLSEPHFPLQYGLLGHKSQLKCEKTFNSGAAEEKSWEFWWGGLCGCGEEDTMDSPSWNSQVLE